MCKKRVVIITVALLLFLALVIGAIYVFAFYLPKRRELEQITQVMRNYYDAKVSSYKDENAKYQDYEVDVVFLGDSLTDGYDLGVYYPQYVTLNRGIGGDTSYGLEARLQVSVYDVKPKVAVMLIGANNFSTMMDNYENILIGFKENIPETKIILLSLTSMSGEWGKNNQIAAYNNVKIKKLAEKYGYDFVDLYSPLMNLESGGIYDEYTTDGGHLTPLGYNVVTGCVTPVLEKLLAE